MIVTRMSRKSGRRVIGYVYAPTESALADPVAFLDRSARAQEAAIRSWAESQGGALVEALVDNGPAGLEGVGAREAFGKALARVRDGQADVVCVASVGDIAGEMVLQELLLAEARAARVPVASALADDAAILGAGVEDPARDLIRQVLSVAPEFQGQMRSLRARLRREQTLDELESAHATMVRVEEMEEHGAAPRDILAMVAGSGRAPKPHRILGLLRGRAG